MLNFGHYTIVLLSLETFYQIVWLHFCVCVYREYT